jgi:hypothetical protein
MTEEYDSQKRQHQKLTNRRTKDKDHDWFGLYVDGLSIRTSVTVTWTMSNNYLV